MKKENEFRIGLALNAIATMLDDESFKKIKNRLDDIEKIVVEDRDNEDSNAE